MRNFTKNVRRQIRELASKLYERELNEELTKLDQHFEAWRKGDLSPFDLVEKIHHFHQNSARELFNRFSQDSPLDAIVAQGIVCDMLKPEEVPPAVMEALERYVAFYQNMK